MPKGKRVGERLAGDPDKKGPRNQTCIILMKRMKGKRGWGDGARGI